MAARAEKFNINTVTTDDKQLQQNPEEFWTSHHRIVSLNTAKSPKHYPQRNWDLVIVEAHHLKNQHPSTGNSSTTEIYLDAHRHPGSKLPGGTI